MKFQRYLHSNPVLFMNVIQQMKYIYRHKFAKVKLSNEKT